MVAHGTDPASVGRDRFYLEMDTVTLKGLTHQPRLSRSGPSYLLTDFFLALSAGRTRPVQICTTTRRKRQGGTLHHYLPNERSPHIQAR